MRATLTRAEATAARKEDNLRQEIQELQERLQEAASREQQLKQNMAQVQVVCRVIYLFISLCVNQCFFVVTPGIQAAHPATRQSSGSLGLPFFSLFSLIYIFLLFVGITAGGLAGAGGGARASRGSAVRTPARSPGLGGGSQRKGARRAGASLVQPVQGRQPRGEE